MKTAFAALLLAIAFPALAQPTERPVDLATPTGTIHGTLWTTRGDTRVPVVLLVAGSGPTDRDGNQPRLVNDSLKQLAASLAVEGIATLRYDKRGVGASRAAAPAEKDLRFEHYVDDAVAWLEWLKADPRFSVVALLGHSEGAHIGALAAARAGAGAYVSIVGLGRKPAEVLRTQLKPKLPEPFWSQSERILATLEKGETTTDVPKELMILYRPSVQPYLVSWFRQSPAEAMAKLEMPGAHRAGRGRRAGGRHRGRGADGGRAPGSAHGRAGDVARDEARDGRPGLVDEGLHGPDGAHRARPRPAHRPVPSRSGALPGAGGGRGRARPRRGPT